MDQYLWNLFRPYAYMIEHECLDMSLEQAEQEALKMDRKLRLKTYVLRNAAWMIGLSMSFGLNTVLGEMPVHSGAMKILLATASIMAFPLLAESIVSRWKGIREYRRVDQMVNGFIGYKSENPGLTVEEYGNRELDRYRI